MRTLLVNALLIDGTGQAASPGGALLVEGERIAALGTAAARATADRTIDLAGLALAPGFIDTHSHSDVALLLNPENPAKLRQGVTTEILGQDGLGPAPLPERFIGQWRKTMAGLNGDSPELDWGWRDMAGYLERLKTSGLGPNAGCLAAHGNVRMEAMGLDDRQATANELAAMQDALERAFDAGALGLSTGLIYAPCVFADAAELRALCAVAARRGRPLVIHQRSEADDILASMREVLDLGRETGVHVHFSHFKICGKKNAPLLDSVLGLLDSARSEGLSVSFDQYPYVAGSTMLSVILPPWAHAGGTDALLARLADPAARGRMLADIASGLPGWDNFTDFAGTDGIIVTSVRTVRNAGAVGMTLDELGAARSKPPLEAALDLLLEEQNAVGMVDFYGLEEHVETFLARPEMNVCTDGLLFGTPHPRAYGAFARVLGLYVRERGVLGLEEAVRKMTGRPAEVFGLTDRGLLRPGMAADLVAFDPAAIRETGAYEAPRQHPEGFRLVMVNGRIEIDGAAQLATRSGQTIRK